MTGARRTKKTLLFKEVAARALGRVDKAGKRHGAGAVSAWTEVVGPDIARHTRGFALRENGELVVFVDSGAWAAQLSLMAEDLTGRLNTRIGERAVTSLRFTVSRKVSQEIVWEAMSAEEEAFYAPDDRVTEPLSDVERDQAIKVASPVKDPELREVALRVMIKDLERKKGGRSNSAS